MNKYLIALLALFLPLSALAKTSGANTLNLEYIIWPILALLIIFFLIIYPIILDKTCKVKVLDNKNLDNEIQDIIKQGGIKPDEIKSVFKSSITEYLILTDTGIITNRFKPSYLFIPYKNINGITKETARGGKYLITLITNIDKEDTRVFGSNQDLSYNQLKEAIDCDHGVIIFESIKTNDLNQVEDAIKKYGFSIREIPYNLQI